MPLIKALVKFYKEKYIYKMSENSKFNAAILIIGNEILSGRTQDTNTSTLATWLNSFRSKSIRGKSYSRC